MATCKNCRYADPAVDDKGVLFFFCRLLPPSPVSGTVPAMKPIGYCGQFKLGLRNWLRSMRRKGNGSRT